MEITKSVIEDLIAARSGVKGTTLVTLYVQPNSNIGITMTNLTKELSESQNIKDKNVKHGVQSALKSCKELLKSYKVAPQNGLVLCAGDVKAYL